MRWTTQQERSKSNENNTTKLKNTKLPGELHEDHRGLKGCARDERCGAVPLAWMLGTCTEFKLQLETSMRTLGSLGIAGSDLGRPAFSGLSSFTTWVEETSAKKKLCDDAKAQVMASERSDRGNSTKITPTRNQTVLFASPRSLRN